MPRRRARGRRIGCGRGRASAACDEPYQPCRVGFAGDSRRSLACPVRPRERARRATPGGRRRGRARARARAGHARATEAARARRLGLEHRHAHREAARRQSPREIATELADGLAAIDGVASAEVAGPGFINIRLDAAAAGRAREDDRRRGSRLRPRRLARAAASINLEFVSANPTGPLHIGHTRWAALGDSIGRVLRAAGAEVANEYYINDAGSQMDAFGSSVLAAAKGEPTPEGGYPGSYIADLAARVLEREPEPPRARRRGRAAHRDRDRLRAAARRDPRLARPLQRALRRLDERAPPAGQGRRRPLRRRHRRRAAPRPGPRLRR